MRYYYLSQKYSGIVFFGTENNFEWSKRNDEFPIKVSFNKVKEYVKNGWIIKKEDDVRPEIIKEIFVYNDRNGDNFFKEGLEFEWEINPQYDFDDIFYYSGDWEVPVYAYKENWK